MKKKLGFSVLVAAALAILLCFVACNGNSGEEQTEDVTAKQTEEKTEAPATDGGAAAEPTEVPEDTVAAEGLWADATYLGDREFGNGAKTVEVEVKVDEQSVTFTISTDADTLGEALLEHSLIEGEQGAYGIYVKRVNGILADYDVNKRYWGFYQNGEYLMSGVDTTDISGGEHFEIVYSK